MRMIRVLVAVLTLLTGAAVAGVPADAVTYRPGASSLGDPLAPGLGNGGYDVTHYDLRLDYRPATGVLTGTATIIATATQNLSRFDLDFVLPARSVTVDGASATFTSKNGPDFSYNRDLVVTPAHGLNAGDGMTVVVRYSTRPAAATLDGVSEWASTPTGVMAWDEPIAAAQWWFPGNDYPSDKATYDVWVTTPKAYTATTNGRLVSRTVSGGDATAYWRSDDPLSTHVAVLTIGRYSNTHSTFGSIPVDVAVEDGLGAFGQRARADLARTPEVLKFLQSQWGPYPFDAAGGIVVGANYPSSLETQTRPVYESGLWQNSASNVWVVVHENSHQWFGDSVTMRRWKDIWLAEGFATYSEWVWSQAQHQGTAQQLFLGTYAEHPAGDGIWSTPLDDPPYPLTTSVYQRGGMLLQALRNRVGTAHFYAIMRGWARQHSHANGSTAEFETLAESVSGQDLAAFFHAWVDSPTRPARTVANGFPPGSAASSTAAPSLAAIQRSDALLHAAH